MPEDLPFCVCGHASILHAPAHPSPCWSGAWVQEREPGSDLPRILWQACTCKSFRDADAAPCPDGGTCHHACTDRSLSGCFRVECCAPLSGVYPGDVWPVPSSGNATP